MKKVLLTGSVVGLFLGNLYAGTLNGGYGVCLSESIYDEWVSTDNTGRNYLLKSNKCFVLNKGVKYSVIDRGWLSSKIRVYVGDTSAVVWTPNENLK